jgi:hypothetical protein
MLMEASGDIVAKVGDTFVVHMDREALNQSALRATLGILARTVAPGKPRPAAPTHREAGPVSGPSG